MLMFIFDAISLILLVALGVLAVATWLIAGRSIHEEDKS